MNIKSILPRNVVFSKLAFFQGNCVVGVFGLPNSRVLEKDFMFCLMISLI
jgi:hypothetical protein